MTTDVNKEQSITPESVTQEGENKEKPPISQENEINWKKFREERERDRKASEEARKKAEEAEKAMKQKEEEAKAFKEAMESLLNKRDNQSYDDDEEESEDDRMMKRMEAMLQDRERKAEERRKSEEIKMIPVRLKQSHKDFDEVCSTENLDYLEYHYPEVAAPYAQLPDTFEKWDSIYKAVKKFVPNTKSSQDQSRIQKNLNKPQSTSSPGRTSTGDSAPIQLDEARKMDNWKRMQRVMKGLN